MGFRIYKWVGSQTIWLKSLSPTIEWGPHGQARSFRTREEAIRASHLIPIKDYPVNLADDASQPDAISLEPNQEPGSPAQHADPRQERRDGIRARIEPS